eukprot:jgi/Mesvir1/16334/Mv18083-RA.1
MAAASFNSLPAEIAHNIVRLAWPYGCGVDKAMQQVWDGVKGEKENLVNDLRQMLMNECVARLDHGVRQNPILENHHGPELHDIIKSLSVATLPLNESLNLERECTQEARDGVGHTTHSLRKLLRSMTCSPVREQGPPGRLHCLPASADNHYAGSARLQLLTAPRCLHGAGLLELAG